MSLTVTHYCTLPEMISATKDRMAPFVTGQVRQQHCTCTSTIEAQNHSQNRGQLSNPISAASSGREPSHTAHNCWSSQEPQLRFSSPTSSRMPPPSLSAVQTPLSTPQPAPPSSSSPPSPAASASAWPWRRPRARGRAQAAAARGALLASEALTRHRCLLTHWPGCRERLPAETVAGSDGEQDEEEEEEEAERARWVGGKGGK